MAKCPECIQKVPEYMATYGDFITLLLCFFIAIYKPVLPRSETEMKLILSAFTGNRGFLTGGSTLSKKKLEDMGLTVEALPSETKGMSFGKALKDATQIFAEEIKQKKVKVVEDERGLVISLLGDNYFAPGSARLTEEARLTLGKLSPLLTHVDNFVRIEGHADDELTPNIQGETYESPWELASQRAINSLRFLEESHGVQPGKMSAVSFGSQRKATKSGTPEGRALNRRMDIVILSGKTFNRDYQDKALPEAKTPGTEWQTP